MQRRPRPDLVRPLTLVVLAVAAVLVGLFSPRAWARPESAPPGISPAAVAAGPAAIKVIQQGPGGIPFVVVPAGVAGTTAMSPSGFDPGMVPAAPNALAAATPVNDQCAGALTIPATAPNSSSLSPIVDLMDATDVGDPANGPTSAFRASRSVWFKYVATRSGTYTIETCGTDGTLQDTVIALFLSSCSPLSNFTGNDDVVVSGTTFDTCRHRSRTSFGAGIGTGGSLTVYIAVWKFGMNPPPVGESSVQVRVVEVTNATATATATAGVSPTAATPTSTPTVTRTPTPTATATATPTAIGAGDSLFAYAKRPSVGSLSGDTVMHLRRSTLGVPAYSGCVAFIFPPSIECDDDEGHLYSTPANVVVPPAGGGTSLNSALAGVPLDGGESLMVQGFSATTVVGPYDLYVHRPNGTGSFVEAEGNDTLGGANAVPALPACSSVFSEGTGNPRPRIAAGGLDVVALPPASTGWVGSAGMVSNTDVDYFGPIAVGAAEAVFVAVDGAPDCAGCPHDRNGINADLSLDLRSAADISLQGSVIDGSVGTTTAGQATGEFFSGTPGQAFYIRVNAKTGDIGKGYRLTACSLGVTAGNTPVPTATQDPLNPFTPTPTWTPSPTATPQINDTCASAVALTLNQPALGSLAGARNDYQLPALSSCFTANGAIGNPTPSAVTALGRDVVYSFTAPAAGTYSFHLSNVDPLGGANLLLHLSSDCPTAEGTATPAATPSPTNTPAVSPACVAAANRNSTTTFAAEEVPCLAMTAGQTVYVFVDEATYLASQLGGGFYLEVTTCISEVEPNNLSSQSNAYACGIQGVIMRTPSPTPSATTVGGPTNTPTPTNTALPVGFPTITQTPAFGENDFFALPTAPSSEHRLFALVDMGAGNVNDVDLRLMTNGDTLEYDAGDNDTLFGVSAPNLGGALFNVTPQPGAFLRINAPSLVTTAEPYRVYAVVQPPRPQAVTESEPNDSLAQANSSGSYYFGNLEGSQPRGNNLVGTGASVDADLYRFNAAVGDLIFLSVDGDPLRDEDAYGKSPINPQLVLLDASGRLLLRVNEASTSLTYATGLGQVNTTSPQGGQSEGLYFRAPYTGTFYAGVAAGAKDVAQLGSGRFTSVGEYLLSISLNCAPYVPGVSTPTPTALSSSTPTPAFTPTPSNTPLPDSVDIVLTKTESADPVTAGSGASNLTYVVTARNVFDGEVAVTATNLQIQETLTLPAGVTVVSVTPGSGSVSGTAPNLLWTIPSLASGASTTLTVVLTVGAATLPGTDVVGDTATVTNTDQQRSNTGDDTVTVRTSVITRADLNAVKTPSTGTVIAGSNVSYTVSTTNAGPSDAQTVVLTDSLPANGAFVSATASAGGSCTTPAVNAVGGTVTCTWAGATAPGAQRSVTIVERSCAGNLCNSTQVNAVTASSATTDPGPQANTASSNLTVQSQSDLSISKTGAPNPVVPGNALVYSLTVNNAGPSNAAGVTVVDTLPAGVTFVSATVNPAGPVCSVALQVVTCNLGIMGAAGQCGTTLPTAYTITINTTVNANTPCSPAICPGSPGAPLSNTATVSTTNCLADPNGANNTTTVTTNVRAGSDVLLGVQVFHLGSNPLNLADLAAMAAAGDLVAEARVNRAQRAALSGNAAATTPDDAVSSSDTSQPSQPPSADLSPAPAAPAQLVDCIASGDFVRVVYTFSNTGPLAVTTQRDNPGPEFEAEVPAQIALQQNTCAVSAGTGLCTVTNNGERIEWNGTIPVGGTVSVFYIGRIRPGVVNGDRIPFTGTVHFDIFNIGQNTASRTVAPAAQLLIGCPVLVEPNAQLGSQVHLPILNFQGQDDVCRAMIEVQYIGCDPSKAVLVTWGEPGFCPPQAAGPLKVECTGLLYPGSSWILMGAQIPTGSKGGMLFKFTARQLTELGIDLGFDDVVADLMCETLFFGVVGDADDYRRFKKAYNEGLDFAGINQGVAAGEGILAVEVLRHCPGDVTPGVEVSAKYIGIAGTHLGAYDPVFGGFGYYVPLVYANKAGLNTVMYIQNGGLECSSLELWFKAQDDCLRARICDVATVAPGETYQFDASDCVGPDWQGAAWIRASEWMGVAVDIYGRDLLMTYIGEPVPYAYSFDDGTGLSSPSTGEKVAYGPLIYSEYQGWDAGVQVMNLSPLVNAKVKVYFLDRSGDVITTLVDWVCPRGSQTFFLPIVADLPGSWVGSVRIESQVWWTPGTNEVQAPDIVGVATLMKYGDVARTEAQQALAYNLLPEHKAYKWQIGGRSNGGLESGVGLIAIPSMLKDLDGSGVTSETAIMNLVAKPGFTDFAIYLYDQNGLLDFVCQKLSDRQVEYIDLQTWGYVSNGFKGSAVISATYWEHEVFDGFGFPVRNLVGLGAVLVERTGTRLGEDIPGDEAAGDRGIPFGVDQDLSWCPGGHELPVCPGQPEFPSHFRVGIAPVGTAGNIPDAGATAPGSASFTMLVTLSPSCRVTDVDLQIDVTHPRTEDLDAFLTHGAVTDSELLTDLCAGNALGLNLQAVLDDDSSPGIGTAACLNAVGGGRRQATEGGGGLNAFDGQSATGAWTLKIQDDFAGSTGRLNSATLAGTCFRQP